MRKSIYILILLLFGIFCFSQSRYISETTKKVVFTRDAGVCRCCGSSQNLEYDHVVPFSCGGSSKSSNIQLLCQKCNRSKSNGCYCKIHNKKVGDKCCNGDKSVTKTKRSNSKSSVSKRCKVITQKGTRCKKRTTNSNGRCYLHQ